MLVAVAAATRAERPSTLEEIRAALPELHGEELAMAHLKIGRMETDPALAAASLKKAHDLSEKYRGEALISMGELSLLVGDPKAAVQFFDRAARLGQRELAERASYLRAAALYMDGRHADAREAFADYLIDFLDGANQSRARLGIAAANEGLGRSAEAAEIYRAVLDQNPGLPEEPWILDRLFRLYDRLDGRRDDAKKYRAMLAERFPGYESAGLSVIPAGEPSVSAGVNPVSRPEAVRPAKGAATRSTLSVAPPVATAETGVAPLGEPIATSVRSVTENRTAAKGDYYLQVGAFGVRENAEKLRATLRENGYASRTAERKNLTIVLAGPFARKADAEAEKGRLESLLKVRALLVTAP